MNVPGTVCQRIHYFPGKQRLAIDPTWTALKVNNARGFDFFFLIVFSQNTTLFIKFNIFLSFVMKYIAVNYYIYIKSQINTKRN